MGAHLLRKMCGKLMASATVSAGWPCRGPRLRAAAVLARPAGASGFALSQLSATSHKLRHSCLSQLCDTLSQLFVTGSVGGLGVAELTAILICAIEGPGLLFF